MYFTFAVTRMAVYVIWKFKSYEEQAQCLIWNREDTAGMKFCSALAKGLLLKWGNKNESMGLSETKPEAKHWATRNNFSNPTGRLGEIRPCYTRPGTGTPGVLQAGEICTLCPLWELRLCTAFPRITQTYISFGIFKLLFVVISLKANNILQSRGPEDHTLVNTWCHSFIPLHVPHLKTGTENTFWARK